MSLILILREEAVCIVILLFLLFALFAYNMGRDKQRFLRLTLTALGHCIFDVITVITVNTYRDTSSVFNDALHIAFYMFALLFSCEMLGYVASRCFSKKTADKVTLAGFLLPAAYLISILFLPPIRYHEGAGTWLSYGVPTDVAFAVSFSLLVAAFISVLVQFKKLESHVRYSLLPMLAVLIAAGIAQIAVDELLFTGAACTLATVAVFFSLESPAYVFKKKLQMDALTGVKSRHAYEEDIVRFEAARQKGSRFCITFFDINDLKAVNDIHGHLEGDTYISTIANILLTDLESALNVYRMGGDEFMAIFQDQDDDKVALQIEAVNASCKKASEGKPYLMSVAAGCAVSDSREATLKDVLRTADYMMYENKVRIKRMRANELFDSGRVSRAGLSDRIFNAFAGIENNRFYYVINLATNVTRWSSFAVDVFGFQDEYIFDFLSQWQERIHPDDKEVYIADLQAVLCGKQTYHSASFRAKDKDGKYIDLICNGTLLKGRGSEPDLFAGIMRRK